MKYLFLLLAIIVSFSSQSQSVGAGTVSTIESKAKQIVENEDRITKLKKQHFETYAAEKQKLTDLIQSLRNLKLERDEVMDELRKGRFCNGCGNTASQLRKNGTYDVESHFRSNGGTRPAKPEEIQKKETEFERLIIPKEQEIKNFELSENEFTRKRVDIDKQVNDLENQLVKLREEIVQLSKSYYDRVVKEGKSVGAVHIDELMRIVAEKHFIEDRINIISVKIADLNTGEIKALKESDEKTVKKTEEEKIQLTQKINADIERLQQILVSHKNRVEPLKSNLQNLKRELNAVDEKLRNPSILKGEEIEVLQNDRTNLNSKIAEIEKQIGSYEKDYADSKGQLEQNKKKWENEIFELNSNLYKRKADAAELLKKAFTMRRKILEDAKVARNTNLQLTGELLTSKRTSARKKFMEYANDVEKERVRLVNACRNAGCNCYGYDTHGAIVGNWNASEKCISSMESYHYSSSTYYGCENEAPVYKKHYASLINGLSDSDIQALQKQSGKVRYDLILKKISN